MQTRKFSKLGLFSVSLSVRLALAYVFFGSVDLVNAVSDSRDLFRTGTIFVPYLQIVPLFIWIGGVIALRTELPLAFSFKLIPIFFDSMLSMLIYDVLVKRGSRAPFRGALLYAISPLALIVNGLHFQWDSVLLLFIVLAFYLREYLPDTAGRYVLFGLFFGLSVVVKPVTLLFLPFFLRPGDFDDPRRLLRNGAWAAIGFLLPIALCLSAYGYFGSNLSLLLSNIFSYSKGGPFTFGFPMLFENVHYMEDLNARFIAVLPVFIIMIPYYLGRIDIFNVSLLSLCAVMWGVGLAPQYLLWIVPFLLITERYRMAAVYTSLSTVFLVSYYTFPGASYEIGENMATFATLKGLEGLTPPVSWGGSRAFVAMEYLGNILIPLVVLAIAAKCCLELKRDVRREKEPSRGKTRRETIVGDADGKGTTPGYTVILLVFFMVAGLTYAFSDPAALRILVEQTLPRKLSAYNIAFVGNTYQATKYGATVFQAGTFLIAGALCWSGLALWFTKKRPTIETLQAGDQA